eukprot:tig00000889_g5304.t1
MAAAASKPAGSEAAAGKPAGTAAVVAAASKPTGEKSIVAAASKPASEVAAGASKPAGATVETSKPTSRTIRVAQAVRPDSDCPAAASRPRPAQSRDVSLRATICSWDVQHLAESSVYESGLNVGTPLPKRYESASDFYDRLAPLVLETCRAQLIQAICSVSPASAVPFSFTSLSADESYAPLSAVGVTLRACPEDTLALVGSTVWVFCPQPFAGADHFAATGDGGGARRPACTLAVLNGKRRAEDGPRADELDEEPFDADQSFHILPGANAELTEALAMLQACAGNAPWFATPLGTVITEERILAALAALGRRDSPVSRCRLLLPLLQSSLDDERHITVPKDLAGTVGGAAALASVGQQLESSLRAILDLLKRAAGLNVSQVAAIEDVLFGSDPATLIHGPPGTGKTQTLAVYLLTVLAASRAFGMRPSAMDSANSAANSEEVGAARKPPRMRVLVTAPTNAAVVNVARKLLKVGAIVARGLLASEEGRAFASAVALDESALAIVGDEGRMELNEALSSIFVPHRARRILLAAAEWNEVFSDAARRTARGLAAQPPGFERHVDRGKLVELLAKLVSDNEARVATLERDMPAGVEKGQSCVAAARSALETLVTRKTELETGGADPLSNNEYAVVARALEAAAGALKGLERIDRTSLERAIVREACVVFSTITGAQGFFLRNDDGFSVAVVDEAAQAPEALTSLVFRRSLQSLVLIGDPRQLQATISSKSAEACGYGRSLFERLEECGVGTWLLDTQYRMHEEIALFPNFHFYGNLLKHAEGVSIAQPWHEDEVGLFPPLCFIDVRVGAERTVTVNGAPSYLNDAQIEVVAYLCQRFAKKYASLGAGDEQDGGGRKLSIRARIGIISPYRAQVEAIEAALSGESAEERSWKSKVQKRRERLIQIASGKALVEVKTVDGFQGGEKDVIILSLVRSNRNVGFLEVASRLNVAITRAKHSLVIVGHGATLRMDEDWNALLESIEQRAAACQSSARPTVRYVNASEHKQLLRRIQGEMGEKRLRELRAAVLHLGENTSRPGTHSKWRMNMTAEAFQAFSELEDRERQAIAECALKLAEGKRSRSAKMRSPLVDVDVGFFVEDSTSTATAGGVQMKHPLELYPIKVESILEFRVFWGFAWVHLQDKPSVEQCIKIYGIVKVDQTNEATLVLEARERLAREVVGMYSDEYLQGCRLTDRDLMAGPRCVPVADFAWYRKGMAEKPGGEGECHADIAKSLEVPAEVLRRVVEGGELRKSVVPLMALSPEEMAIVQQPGSIFVLGRGGSGKTTVLLTRMVANEMRRRMMGADWRQMLITANPRLCGELRAELQKMFNTLPLASTDAAAPPANGREVAADRSLSDCRSLEDCLNRRVDYRLFRTVYYDSFPEPLRRKKDPRLLFSEFLSLIKGSEDAILGRFTEGRAAPVPRQPFVADPESSEWANSEYAWRSAFSDARTRNEVYDLFEAYEEAKRRRGEHDVADVVLHAFAELRAGRVRFNYAPLHFAMVDEVQDLSIAQVALFSFVCCNKDGFALAGDTAQTIAQGSGFRFEDVKSFFYKHAIYLFGERTDPDSKVHVPPVCLLQRNFRTHTGVLNLSNSIVFLLQKLFPNAVDGVEMEEALKHGPLPIVVRSPQLTDASFAGLLSQKDWTANQAGFEFQDVVLYNFVSGSPFAKLFNVLSRIADGSFSFTHDFEPELLRYGPLCHELKILYVAVTRTKGQLVFFEDGNAAEPFERLWQASQHCKESGADGGGQLVHATKNVQEGLDALSFAGLAKTTSREEWRKRGMQCMELQQYENARTCFRNARDERGLQWVKAEMDHERGLREAAMVGNGASDAKTIERGVELLSGAAEQLLALSPPMAERASEWCVEAVQLARGPRAGSSNGSSKAAAAAAERRAKDVARRVAKMLEGHGRHSDAGRVLVDAGLQVKSSAESGDDRAESLKRALDACLQRREFKRVLTILESNTADQIAPETLSKVLLECARRVKREEALPFLKLLPLLDERAKQLEAYRFFKELIDLEKERGDYERAARIQQCLGDFLGAAASCRLDGNHMSALYCTLFYAIR